MDRKHGVRSRCGTGGAARRVIQLWDENTVTWNTQPAVTTAHQVMIPGFARSKDKVIDVTQLLQDMSDDRLNSYGFCLSLAREGYPGNAMYFASSDNSNAALRPKLVVTYHSGKYVRQAGKKAYELKDHLGNVTATVSDLKGFYAPTGITSARVLSFSNYYPFGQLQSERSYATGRYRYGFNGKEKDSEFLNNYDFGARIYDPRLCRWLSIDPLAIKYPGLSPFNFVDNSPIQAVDPDGRDIIVLNDVHGANGAGHQAVLIGNDRDGWTYISKDGFKQGPFGSEPIYTVKTFKTIEEFANSSHNFVVDSESPYFKPTEAHPHLTNSYDENGNQGSGGGGIMDWNFYETDENGNRVQRYDKAFYIVTDSKSDAEAIRAAIGAASESYCLTNCDCSDVVTAALNKSKTLSGGQVQNGESREIPVNPSDPSAAGKIVKNLGNDRPNFKQEKIEERNKGNGISIDGLISPTTTK